MVDGRYQPRRAGRVSKKGKKQQKRWRAQLRDLQRVQAFVDQQIAIHAGGSHGETNNVSG